MLRSLPWWGIAWAVIALDGVAQTPGGAEPTAERSAAEAPASDEQRAPDTSADRPTAAQPSPAQDQSTAPAVRRDAPVVSRLEALLEFNRLAGEKHYDAALPVGEQFLKLTEAEFGAESLRTAEAYETVARVQSAADEHVLSEQNYLHAVELIRNIDGTFSELAIEPLIGLGDNYQEADQYLNAITAYNEAHTINRRVYGLLNEKQIPILNRITDSLQALERYPDADEQQLTILHLAERNYPEGSTGHLEAIYRYAGWLRESGRYNDEREQYARAMRIIRDQDGKESLRLVKPLRETGNSFRVQRIPEGQGISDLRTALELLETHGGEAEPLAMAEVLRDLGDWDVAFSKVEPDLELYRRSWELLDDVENGETLRSEWYGMLQNILGEPISQRGLSKDPDALQGYVVVQFDVDRYGRTENVAVVRSQPVGLKDDAVTRAVQNWRFRPAIVDGEVVRQDDMALQFNYRYLPDESE